VTPADRQLMDALAERGLEATPTQFKRWRAAGVLTPPLQRSAGRGKGRRSERYPPEAVDQAATILELLTFRVPLKHMAVALVVRGIPVTDAAVRKAFLDILPTPDVGEVDDVARADEVDQYSAQLQRRARRIPLLHHWAARARGTNEPGRFVLSDMLSALMQLTATGTPPSVDAEAATGHILGIDSDEIQSVIAVMQSLDVDSLRTIAQDVTASELHTALQPLREVFAESGSGDERPDFETAGVMILAMAALARVEGTSKGAL
jgi:hypothetical protein